MIEVEEVGRRVIQNLEMRYKSSGEEEEEV